jgi:hypothetical protein
MEARTTPQTVPAAKAGAPLREKPADFREQFIRLGWDAVDHYATSWKVVARWLDEEGRAGVKADRKAFRQLQALEQRFTTIVDATPSVMAVSSARAIGRLIADVGATLRQTAS